MNADHASHTLVVREWTDAYASQVTAVGVECSTCGEELAFFEKPRERRVAFAGESAIAYEPLPEGFDFPAAVVEADGTVRAGR